MTATNYKRIRTIIGNGKVTGGGGVSDHNLLTNRNIANQHIIGAINVFTLAELNAQLSSGSLDLDSATRDPNSHSITALHTGFPGPNTLYLDGSGNFSAPRIVTGKR